MYLLRVSGDPRLRLGENRRDQELAARDRLIEDRESKPEYVPVRAGQNDWDTAILLRACAGRGHGSFGGYGRLVRVQGAPGLYAELLRCHTEARSGGLRLDSAEGVAKGGNSGPAVVPGKPEDSLLVQAVRQTHARLKMPPGGKLKDDEIAAIDQWVKAGAVWPKGAARRAAATSPAYVITPEQRAFWAFQRVRKPAAATVKNAVVRAESD